MEKRDLKADLEICNNATDEPWEWVVDKWNGGFSGIVNDKNEEVLFPNHRNEGDDGDAWFEDFPSEADAEFIVQAREGWPHALERAIEAEALVRELREALNKIAYPVRYLQNEADEKNFSLDGRVATELANSSHWLKSIAKEVLGDEI